jgi:acetyl-CoA carboxylase biotin carboxyl carrier protein
MVLSDEDVQEILQLLDSSPYDELHLETDRFRLTLRRSGAGGWTREAQTLIEPRIEETSENPPAETAQPAGTEGKPSADGLVDIPAPMMGTFYRAPKPGADPFVEVGSRVQDDTIIAIIEVMKLMNSIRAEAKGQIEEICVENGEAVEQGQVLMRVKPEK